MHHFEQRLVLEQLDQNLSVSLKPQHLDVWASGRFIQHLDMRIWHLVVLFSIWPFYSASRRENLASRCFIQHLVVLFSIWTKEFGIWPFYSASGRFIQHLDKRIWHLAVLFSISLSKKNLASGRFIQHLDFSSSQIPVGTMSPGFQSLP